MVRTKPVEGKIHLRDVFDDDEDYNDDDDAFDETQRNGEGQARGRKDTPVW